MKREQVDILGVWVDKINMADATSRALSFLEATDKKMIFTPNPEFILLATTDEAYKKILNQGDLVVPDGIGLIYGARLLQTPLIERVPGVELVEGIISNLSSTQSVFFLGAAPGVAGLAAEKMKERYPHLLVAGSHHGYFLADETDEILKKINDSQASILLVGLGTPRQEKWIYHYRQQLYPTIFMGVGGSFDALAGTVKRAPVIFQKLHLEWFYRLIQEPKRIKRQIFIPQYLWAIIKERYSRP